MDSIFTIPLWLLKRFGTFMSNICFISAVCGVAALSSSCSRETETIVDNSDYYSKAESTSVITKSALCSKDECTPTTMSSRIEGASTGVFKGTVGTPITWKIQGYDPLTEKEKDKKKRRKIVVLLNRLPENSLVTPTPTRSPLSSLVTINWVPKTAQEGWLEIILRDFDRCLALETDPDLCQNYSLLSDYDTRQQTIPWLISKPAS